MKNTAARYYFNTFIWTTVLEIGFLIIFDPFNLIGLLPREEDDKIKIYVLIVATCIMVYILYNLFQFIYYNSIKLIERQNVKLGNYDISMTGLAAFTIHVILKDEIKDAKTKHIFFCKTFGKNSMYRYMNKHVEVGYNAQRDEWVVITLPEEIR